MHCQNNLKQLMLSLHGFEDTNTARFPPTGHSNAPTGHLFPPGCFGSGGEPDARLSWMVAVLPYMEQGNLYQEFALEEGYADNLPLAQTIIKTFLCPESAFYLHILLAPVVLLNGLILLSAYARRHHRGAHRLLGRLQLVLLLMVVLPSSAVMSRHAFGGWPAGLSFLLLSAATAVSAIAGVVYARRRRYDLHRRWMLRSYVWICSAVALWLISGAAEQIGVSKAEDAYIVAAWSSWLVPLAGYEIVERLGAQRLARSRNSFSSI